MFFSPVLKIYECDKNMMKMLQSRNDPNTWSIIKTNSSFQSFEEHLQMKEIHLLNHKDAFFLFLRQWDVFSTNHRTSE